MISIDYRKGQPIYEQLVENIKQLVLRGVYEPDSQLPSVRQLAGEIGINPNTIQKAYAELERQGVIYSVSGRGNFITSETEALQKERKNEMLTQLKAIIIDCVRLGVSKEELIRLVQEAYDEAGKEGQV